MRRAGVIRLRRMRFWGRHGVTEEERASPQELELDVEIVIDIERVCASDDVHDTVDYTGIYRKCERIVTQRSFNVLEALAEQCLQEILSDGRIERATVRVRKPQLLDGATPEVEVTKSARDAY